MPEVRSENGSSRSEEFQEKFSRLLDWSIAFLIGVGLASVMILIWVFLGLDEYLPVATWVVGAAAGSAVAVAFLMVAFGLLKMLFALIGSRGNTSDDE